jgi:hypothetical protein
MRRNFLVQLASRGTAFSELPPPSYREPQIDHNKALSVRRLFNNK